MELADAAAPPFKRTRTLAPNSQAFLRGTCICVPPCSRIPHLGARLKGWDAAVKRAGGVLTLDPELPCVTHVLLGEGAAGQLPPSLLARAAQPQRAVALVDHSWLEQSLLHKQRQPEANHPPAAAPPPAPSTLRPGSSCGRGPHSEPGGSSDEGRLQRRRWLGEDLWHPACAAMSQTELALQAVYSAPRSRAVGNEGLAAALRELARYERALHEDYWEDEAKGGKVVVNHRVRGRPHHVPRQQTRNPALFTRCLGGPTQTIRE
jgi:hypothetical protein